MINSPEQDKVKVTPISVSISLIDKILHTIPLIAHKDINLAFSVVEEIERAQHNLRVWAQGREYHQDKRQCDNVFTDNIDYQTEKIVYLVTEGTNQKIGVAQDVYKRIIGMQTSCPYELKIVATYTPTKLSAFDLEKTLHSHYATSRLKGEWFSINLSAEEFKEVCEVYDKVS